MRYFVSRSDGVGTGHRTLTEAVKQMMVSPYNCLIKDHGNSLVCIPGVRKIDGQFRIQGVEGEPIGDAAKQVIKYDKAFLRRVKRALRDLQRVP